MKRIVVGLALLIVFVPAFAQKGKVTSALNFKDTGKLDQAIETIQTAIDPANEKAKSSIGWPRTWEVRGEIYQALFQSTDEKWKTITADPLTEALDSYKKALELDADHKFSKSLKIKLTLLNNDLQSQAVKAFNDNDFRKALQSFEQVLEIGNLPVITSGEPGAVDTVILYNTGLAASNAGEYDKAIGYYREAARLGYNGGKTYLWIAGAYEQKGDTLGALESLKEGFEKYPGDNEILTGMIQVYMNLDRREEALKYLEMAIRQDPANASYYLAQGTLYEKTGDGENAVKAYEKAIQTDPKMFMGFYNLGVFYYNKGVVQMEAAGKIPPNENAAYEKELKKADAWWEKALPYMEKCHELNPEDAITVESLRNLYYRLKQMDKYNAIREEQGQ